MIKLLNKLMKMKHCQLIIINYKLFNYKHFNNMYYKQINLLNNNKIKSIY